ncbi:hypothetical protein [Actinomadura sp. K4S16]|uniref:hypothetical protein n=1 Tax=Actinomadura sp. K4S16 TaxID=1316147 RepID=UPI0011EC5B33|nr:hypothetical protein [Actinomadura sp. K4S16]
MATIHDIQLEADWYAINDYGSVQDKIAREMAEKERRAVEDARNEPGTRRTADGVVTWSRSEAVILDQAEMLIGRTWNAMIRPGLRKVEIIDFDVEDHSGEYKLFLIVQYRGRTYRIFPGELRN